MDWENVPEDTENCFGFVYIIINKIDKKYYIGKKLCSKRIKRPPLKGTKRKRIDYVESDWRKYYGSSKTLLDDLEKHGEGNFRRIILLPCSSKWECNFFELKYQIHNNVLYDERSYNGIINIRLNKAPKGVRDIPAKSFDLDIASYM